MTAQPAAMPSSPPKSAIDGNAALAALFATATVNSMHRQLSSSMTASPSTLNNSNNSNNCNRSGVAASAAAMIASFASSSPSTSSSTPSTKRQKNQATPTSIDKDSGNSAAQFLASLLNSASKQQQNNQLLASATNKSITMNGSSTIGSLTKQHKSSIMAHLTPKSNKTPMTKKNAAIPMITATVVSPNKTLIAKSTKVTCEMEPNNSVELRNLQTWHDEDEGLLDESCYQELVDLGNTNGWSADEMFKYNEKRHKITSSYNERTLGDNYTTPLPQNKSKTTLRIASKLAKEIEDKVQLEGRITPESSDDDELFELEMNRRIQLRQQKQLDQLRSLKAINSLSIHSQNGRSSNNLNHPVDLSASSGSSDGGSTSTTNGPTNANNRRPPPSQRHNNLASGSRSASNKSSSQNSNSSTTPITASLSSSPTLNNSISHQNVIKMTSSSRNILRTCLI